MKRPSHKELYGKIREAKKAVAEDKVLIVEQEAVAADALDLEYLLRQSYWTFFRNSLRKRARVITLAQGRRKGHMNGRLKGWSFLHSVSRVIGSSAAFIINSPLLKSFFGSFRYIKIEAIRRPHDSRKVPKRAWNYGFEKN